MPAYICLLEIQLDLRHSQNLKEKRKVVASLKAQLRQRFVAAVAETPDHHYPRRPTLLVGLRGSREVGFPASQL